MESKYSGAKYKAPVSTIGSQADRQGYQAIHAGEAIGQQAEAEKNAAVDNLGDKFLTLLRVLHLLLPLVALMLYRTM